MEHSRHKYFGPHPSSDRPGFVLQPIWFRYGYALEADGYYGNGTSLAVEAFNRHFCPEIFIKETIQPPHTGDDIRDPKNTRWYGISQERLDFLLTHSWFNKQ